MTPNRSRAPAARPLTVWLLDAGPLLVGLLLILAKFALLVGRFAEGQGLALLIVLASSFSALLASLLVMFPRLVRVAASRREPRGRDGGAGRRGAPARLRQRDRPGRGRLCASAPDRSFQRSPARARKSSSRAPSSLEPLVAGDQNGQVVDRVHDRHLGPCS